jgi:ribosomal protein S27AE
MNNQLSHFNKRKCHRCGSDKTSVTVTEEGTAYPIWHSNSSKVDIWLCGKCYALQVLEWVKKESK